MVYANRREAGRQLAYALNRFKSRDVVVLALPRGGVVLGAEVAKALRAPLGLIFVRKLEHPQYPEYAVGAVAEGKQPVLGKEAKTLRSAWLRDATTSARQLLKYRRQQYYGGDFIPPQIKGKIAIIVDDGIATSLSMQAAVRAAKAEHPKQIIVAAPVATQESIDTLSALTDHVVVLISPRHFRGAVGAHYYEFEQVKDEEVYALLREVRNDVRQTNTRNR